MGKQGGASSSMVLTDNNITKKIYMIRGMQVMLDRDLSELYQVETRTLNQAVKRNKERFPAEFMFQFTQKDIDDWMSQIVISNKEKMGLRKKPYAFTEQGVAMLAGVLKSNVAIRISVQIIQSFIQMRKLIADKAGLFQRMDQLEKKQLITDTKLEQIFQAIENKSEPQKQGVFFDGQVFDAYRFISDLIRSAKHSIILIDNYIDDTVLTLFTKRNKKVSAVIYTKNISKQLELDLRKHNEQYPPIVYKSLDVAHDRFLILDEERVYHIGASLKDLGKKWFAFSKIEKDALKILDRIKQKK